MLSEQNKTIGLHCVCTSNDHGRRAGPAIYKASHWNSGLSIFAGFPLNFLMIARATNHSEKIEHLRGWNGSKSDHCPWMHIREWLSSLHQKEHSQHLCLQQQGPQWAQRHQSLPSPDGRRAGLALSKAGWGQAQNHSQRSTARLNQCRPAGMTDLQQGKATIRSWGLHTEPANDTNRRNLQKCYLGISWLSGCDQGSPTKTMCGPRGEFQNRTQRSESQNAAGRRKRDSARLGLLRPAACLRRLDLLHRPLHLPLRLLHLLRRLLHLLLRLLHLLLGA